MRGRWSLGERTESKAAVSSHSRRLHEEEQNNPSDTLDRSSTTEESLHTLILDAYLKSLLSQTPLLGSERFSFKEINTVIQTESDHSPQSSRLSAVWPFPSAEEIRGWRRSGRWGRCLEEDFSAAPHERRTAGWCSLWSLHLSRTQTHEHDLQKCFWLNNPHTDASYAIRPVWSLSIWEDFNTPHDLTSLNQWLTDISADL